MLLPYLIGTPTGARLDATRRRAEDQKAPKPHPSSAPASTIRPPVSARTLTKAAADSKIPESARRPPVRAPIYASDSFIKRLKEVAPAMPTHP